MADSHASALLGPNFKIQTMMIALISMFIPLECRLRCKIFNYLIWKSFQNDEEWLLFYCEGTLGCWVTQDFDLCKSGDLWCQYGYKVVLNHKTEYLSRLFLHRTETVQLLHSSQSSILCPQWHFHGSTMGSRPSPLKGENQSYLSSRRVIRSCCSFSVCEWIWTLQVM